MSSMTSPDAMSSSGTSGRRLTWLPRDPTVLLAGGMLVAIIALAVSAPWIAPYDPYQTGHIPFLPPSFMDGGSPDFLLGTDQQGRDLLSRLLYGTRNTLLTGFLAVLFGGGTGVTLGIIAAYFQRLDPPIMRCVDVLLSFPAILLGLSLAAVVGPGTLPVIIALSIAAIPDVARITRSTALVVMGQEYMEAGRAIGLSDSTLIVRYLGLNCIGSVFVFLTLRFGQVILIGAALSFLGLGVRPPEAELGMMASQGRDALFFAAHIATLPSLVIFVMVLCANLLGDALRDALDPRMRNL
ncbi:MAG: ABC transporter permease [Hyphomicrobiales bacterium]|nr:MAG: ABC transporter permease [Hyphomicrobiales bacterium]